MKKTFKTSLIATIICILSFSAFTPLSAQIQNGNTPYIEVRASVTRKVSPDELYLTITIKESDYKGKKSLDDVQRTMLEVLEKNKINVDKNLTVLYMGSSIKLKNFVSKVKTRTEAVYILKLGNVATMQNVISSLEEKEISNIRLTDTRYSQKNKLENELGKEAILQAKQRAIELTEAIGQEIGKAIYINSWSMNEIAIPRNYKMMGRATVMAEDAGGSETLGNDISLSVADKEYSLDVNVRFELK